MFFSSFRLVLLEAQRISMSVASYMMSISALQNVVHQGCMVFTTSFTSSALHHLVRLKKEKVDENGKYVRPCISQRFLA